MKRIAIILVAISFLAAVGWLAWSRYQARIQVDELQTETARVGNLEVAVEADGFVRSNQSAVLVWQTSGTVAEVLGSLEEVVVMDQVLASLDLTTLPPNVILAQADLVNAQRELDNLESSQTPRAEAYQRVEQAQQALDDALSPQGLQAEAMHKLAEAQAALEDAQDNFEITNRQVSQDALDQAKANLLIAERVLNTTLDNIERINKRLRKDESDYMFFESKELYKRILEGLENKRLRDQRQYDRSLEKYNNLLEPPDPLDVAIAEGNVRLKQAELEQAQTEYDRIKGGLQSGEIAVLEAELADALREWQRWEDGPDSGEIASAQARLDAARATFALKDIRAPFNGVLTSVYTHAGDVVRPGSLAFKLDDLSRLLVEARVSEIDINKIRLGQPAVLRFDSIPGEEFGGTVVEVPLVGNAVQDVVTYKVTIEIANHDGKVRPGMTASARIITTQLDQVLLVPNRALRISNGERVIYIMKDGELLQIPVQLGTASDTYTQVLSGELSAGDVVVLNPPASEAEGSRTPSLE